MTCQTLDNLFEQLSNANVMLEGILKIWYFRTFIFGNQVSIKLQI